MTALNKRHLEKRAKALGLPRKASPEEILNAARDALTAKIGMAPPHDFNLLPPPSPNHPAMTVEVRKPIAPLDMAHASASERGEVFLAASLRRELASTLIGELMRTGWVTVRTERVMDENGQTRDQAVATLSVIGSPTSPAA